MKRILVELTLLFIFLIAVEAQQPPPSPQVFVAAHGQTFYLDLDTPEGRFSEWRYDDINSVSALRVTLRIPMLREDPKWVPAFAVWLRKNEGGISAGEVGLEILTMGPKTPLSVRIVEYEEKKLVQAESFNKEIRLDEPVEAEIVWKSSKIVSIKVGDEVRTLNIPWWPINSIAVTGSTGEIKLDPLVFGNLSP